MHTLPTELEFKHKYYDLYTSDLSELRRNITDVANRVIPEVLSGPLNAWIFELAVNALKATYKKVYQKTVLEPLGLDELPYEDWLALFKTEIEEHSAENFAHYCKANDLFVEVSGKLVDNDYRIEVINEGIPTVEEWERIQKILGRAREIHDLEFLFEDNDESDDSRKEGGGIGLMLIIMGLRGLALDIERFQILAQDGKTISRLNLPMGQTDEFNKDSNSFVTILNEHSIHEILYSIYKRNECSIVCFDNAGNMLASSGDLLQKLGYEPGKKEHIHQFIESIPSRFFNEIFHSSRSVHVFGRFDNYRIFIPVNGNDDQILFNISGHSNTDGQVNTIWQQVTRGNKHSLSEGSFSYNMQLYSLVETYIPSRILNKSREVLDVGSTRIPDELIDRTVVFADLEGFTSQAEITEPGELLGLLNLVFSVMVRSIHRADGHVEKFMGDAILATFPDPLKAVIASIEIQNQFYQLNEYRKAGGTVPIRLRIGINSGLVLMGNIGTDNNRDWTPLGDVVNTASRIEKHGTSGKVHISEYTYNRIRDHIEVDSSYVLQARGKKVEVSVYSVSSVNFLLDGKQAVMKLRG